MKVDLDVPDGHRALVQVHGDGAVSALLGHPEREDWVNTRGLSKESDTVLGCGHCSATLVVSRQPPTRGDS